MIASRGHAALNNDSGIARCRTADRRAFRKRDRPDGVRQKCGATTSLFAQSNQAKFLRHLFRLLPCLARHKADDLVEDFDKGCL